VIINKRNAAGSARGQRRGDNNMKGLPDGRPCARAWSLLLAASGLIAGVANAESAPAAAGAETPASEAPAPAAPASPFSSTIGIVSQYVSRGVRQTYRKPAIQGSFDYAHPSGFFVGTWMSNVSSKVIDNATLEWDLYGGYGTELGPLQVSTMFLYYYYPGARTSDATNRTSYDFGELVPSVTWKFFTVKYWLTVTEDYFGYNSDTLGGPPDRHSRWSGYLDLIGNFDLPWGLKGQLHYGYQGVQNFSQSEFQDLKVGLTKSLPGGWTLGAAYTKGFDKHDYYKNLSNTEPGAPTSNPLIGTFIASIGRTF
jgi:uncharacterized protein (TIGR02001 family)